MWTLRNCYPSAIIMTSVWDFPAQIKLKQGVFWRSNIQTQIQARINIMIMIMIMIMTMVDYE